MQSVKPPVEAPISSAVFPCTSTLLRSALLLRAVQMASLQFVCRPLHRQPSPRAAPARGLEITPYRPEADQAVTSSAFFFAAITERRHTSAIDTPRASTALVN